MEVSGGSEPLKWHGERKLFAVADKRVVSAPNACAVGNDSFSPARVAAACRVNPIHALQQKRREYSHCCTTRPRKRGA